MPHDIKVTPAPVPPGILCGRQQLDGLYVYDSEKPTNIDKRTETLILYTVHNLGLDCISTEHHQDYLEHPMLPQVLEELGLKIDLYSRKYSNLPELFDRFIIEEKNRRRTLARVFRTLLKFSFGGHISVYSDEIIVRGREEYLPASVLRDRAQTTVPCTVSIAGLETFLAKHSCLDLEVLKYKGAYRLAEVNEPVLKQMDQDEFKEYQQTLERKYGSDTWYGRYASLLDWFGNDDRTWRSKNEYSNNK